MVAEALRDWLPLVLQAVEPWVSSDNIAKGSHWRAETFERLQQAGAGVLCVTPENVTAPWLTYEAGALMQRSVVVPFLVGIEPNELPAPLNQLQAVRGSRDGTLKLVQTLNARTRVPVDRGVLLRAFDVHWTSLSARLSQIGAEVSSRANSEESQTPARSDESIVLGKLDEVLNAIRELTARAAVPPPVSSAGADIPARPRVFVGSSSEAVRIAEFIQLNLGSAAECNVWTQGSILPGRTVIESLIDLTATSDFAIIVLTPDDFLVKRGDEASAPRDNMIFELGLFMGALGRGRTFMVYPEEGKLHLPSDVAGLPGITYRSRDDGNLRAALALPCIRVKEIMGVA